MQRAQQQKLTRHQCGAVGKFWGLGAHEINMKRIVQNRLWGKLRWIVSVTDTLYCTWQWWMFHNLIRLMALFCYYSGTCNGTVSQMMAIISATIVWKGSDWKSVVSINDAEDLNDTFKQTKCLHNSKISSRENWLCVTATAIDFVVSTFFRGHQKGATGLVFFNGFWGQRDYVRY